MYEFLSKKQKVRQVWRMDVADGYENATPYRKIFYENDQLF